MRKKFAANLIFLFAANLIVKPFWILGIDRVVQNEVGVEVYGTYFAVFNYSFLFSILLDFGINNFNNRAVSRNNKRTGDFVLNLLLLKFFLGLLYFAFTFISASATGYNELQLKMLLFLALNQFLLSVILYFRSNLAALQFFKTDSVISVLDRLLTIVFCLILLYSTPLKDSFDIMWFVYAQTLALLLTALIALGVVMSKTVLKTGLWKFKFTKLILLKSLPFATLALLMGIYYRIDGVMLERMLPDGKQEAGIYAASFRLLDALNQFGFLFATLLLPMFAGMIRKKEDVSQLIKFSSELMFVFAVVAGVNCCFFRNEIMQILYPDSDLYWSKIFGLLMLNFIPMSSVYIFGTLLTANGSLKILNYIAVLGVVINVGLNLLLIPTYGAWGASIATLVTQGFAALAHIVAAGRQFDFKTKLKDTIKILLFVLICVAIAFVTNTTSMNWMLSFIVSLFICSCASVVFNLVPGYRLVTILKSKAAS